MDPYEDLGDVDVSPVSFYGSSFHQSMDDYHGPSLYEREVVVGGTKEPPPQPYYLQTYNQLMQQRNQQQQKFQQQKQQPLQPQQFLHHQMHNFAPQNAVRSTIQRSENNSGISTPTEENISRVNSHEVSGAGGADPGLEDPAVQAFMEKRRMKKERSREDKLMREMLQEAAFMGVSPSKLVASDVSTVEEKSTTYPGRPYADASQLHHVAPIQHQQQAKRPSQTGNYLTPTGLIEMGSKSNDSYDRVLARSSDAPSNAHAQPKQRPLYPHEENQFYAPPQHHQHQHQHQPMFLGSRSNDSYDRPLPPPDALKSRPLPSQPVSPPLPVNDIVGPPTAPIPSVAAAPKATVAPQQAPVPPPVAAVPTVATTSVLPGSAATPAGVPAPDLPPHPLHDFVGIPKGVQFDTLHVMHHDNAEILKIAAALLQKARRHPQLPKTDGIPREVAAVQLATMWLNQATFVRRRAGPDGASSSGKVSSQGQGKPAMVPFPKAPVPRPADPAKARKDPSPTSKLPPSGGPTSTNGANGNAAMATTSVPAAVATLTASPSAASPEQPRPAAALLPAETQVTQPPPQPAAVPLPPQQHFGAPSRSTKESPHQVVPNVAYERQSSPAQVPPPPPQGGVSNIINHYEYLARSGSRDYTSDGGGSPSRYLTPTAYDSPPTGQRAGGRKIMRVPVADEPVHHPPQQQQQQQRRPSPMGTVRPDYARERAGSEGRLYEEMSRPGMMSRQTSTNNGPPPLLQQMSKRGYAQQQQQQQQMQHSYDAYDAPPAQYQQQQQQQPLYPALASGRGYDSYDVYDDEDEYAAAIAVPPLSSSSRNVSTSNAPSGYYTGGYSNGGAANTHNGGAHPSLHHHVSSLSSTSATSHMGSTVVTTNGSWVCKYCTLINDTAESRCSACEAPRSKGPLIV